MKEKQKNEGNLNKDLNEEITYEVSGSEKLPCLQKPAVAILTERTLLKLHTCLLCKAVCNPRTLCELASPPAVSDVKICRSEESNYHENTAEVGGFTGIVGKAQQESALVEAVL